MLDLGRMNMVNLYPSVVQTESEDDGGKRGSNIASSLLNQSSFNCDHVSISPRQSTMGVSPVEDGYIVSSLSSLKGGSLSAERNMAQEVQSSNSVGTSEVSNGSSNRSDLSMNTLDEEPVQDPLDFGPYFQEEYCKASLDGSRELVEVVADVDSGSIPCDREKSEEDGDNDNDDMLGCVFAFSDEG